MLALDEMQGQKMVWNTEFELTVSRTRFAIHFDNFAEHFFPFIVKFASQSLIVKLSFKF